LINSPRAERLHATQFGPLYFEIRANAGADASQRHKNSGTRVGRATNNLQPLLRTIIDRAQQQLVGIRVRLAVFDLRHDHVREIASHGAHRFHFQPSRCQFFSQVLCIKVKRDPLLQPFNIELHSSTL
jgi:hypothetical protein